MVLENPAREAGQTAHAWLSSRWPWFKRPSGNLCFIGMLTFWLLLYENFRPEGVAQSFCELDFSLPLTEAPGKESTNKYCLPFSGQCACKWSHLKKTNQKWILTEISESFFPAQKLLGLGMWMLFFVCLQHHHCNQKMFFPRGTCDTQ